MTFERGKIRDPRGQRQIRDYSGLKFQETITPTDIDGYLWLDGWFIFLELKWNKTAVPGGQERAFEALINKLGDKAIFILADHHADRNTEEQIDAANCKVRKWYLSSNKRWDFDAPGNECTVRQLIDELLA